MYEITIDIIVVIVAILCFMLILFYIINSHKNTMNNGKLDLLALTDSIRKRYTNSLSGGNISNIYSQNENKQTEQNNESNIYIPKTFPQVSILTNYILQTTNLNQYVWLEKTDGVHKNIVFNDNKIYEIVNQKLNFIDNISFTYTKQTILDTELYENKYYIFDVAMFNGEDISTQFYESRMKYLENITLPQNFIVKQYYKVDSINKLLSFISNEHSPITNNVIDGVILQRIDLPYYTISCYKLKRKVMNTIDFLLRYNEDCKCYHLYLYSKYTDYIFNMKKLPRETNYITTDFNEKQREQNESLPEHLYTLFATPYKDNLHIFTPRLQYDSSEYFDSNIQQINSLMSDMLNDPMKYNNKIVEMSLSNDSWVPLRVRNDKIYSNSYNVGITNLGIINAPIKSDIESLYFSKQTAFSEDITNPYHEINKLMRKYIIETHIGSINKSNMSMIDLACGRGADLLSLYHSGIHNIFAVDADIDALVQYVNRTPTTPIMKYEPLLKTFKDNKSKQCILLNSINFTLSEDNNELIQNIKSRYEYPTEKFDVILMNYAIHYLCDKHSKIKALNDFLHTMLKPNGLFIFTYFDGDEILKSLPSRKKELKLKSFTIKILTKSGATATTKFGTNATTKSGTKTKAENKSCDNEVWSKADKDAKFALMPLPTIDSTGYREEPLVLKSFLKDLKLKTLSTYSLYENTLQYTSHIQNHELIEDYLHFIKVCVMIKQ